MSKASAFLTSASRLVANFGFGMLRKLPKLVLQMVRWLATGEDSISESRTYFVGFYTVGLSWPPPGRLGWVKSDCHFFFRRAGACWIVQVRELVGFLHFCSLTQSAYLVLTISVRFVVRVSGRSVVEITIGNADELFLVFDMSVCGRRIDLV